MTARPQAQGGAVRRGRRGRAPGTAAAYGVVMATRITSGDWWFRDRTTGGRTIGQAPNAPMWIVIVALVVAVVAPAPLVRRIARLTANAALAWWAAAEISTGVNPWRRTLGVAVALVDVRSLVRARRASRTA